MLKYPNMRNELLQWLAILANAERTPLKPVASDDAEYRSYFYDIDAAITFMVDDICVTDNPSAMLGVFLNNEAEVDQIEAVGDALLQYIDAERAQNKDVQVRVWHDVQALSKVALSMLKRNDA